MEQENIVEVLNERIKELTCLYELSSIVVRNHDSLRDTLEAAVKILPKAWKNAECAIAELNLQDNVYASGVLPDHSITQKAVIKVNNEPRGFLAIHYPADKYNIGEFLPEEELLLQKLAQELAAIVERFEQKQREEIMERRIKHSDRLAILGEITAGIAHELNTPLANILGFSQLIQERARDGQIKSDAEKIINSTIYSREVVKKLMFFSSEMPQKMQFTAINAFIDDAIKLLGPSLQKEQIALNFEPDPNNVTVQIDQVQMTQVLFNLLINAIHASSPGDKIQVKINSNETRLTMTIVDEGYGMPDDVKDRVFEPFFSTKSTGEGSGLGLSVVHGIIKSHKGTIKLISEEQKGTQFIISLPLTQ